MPQECSLKGKSGRTTPEPPKINNNLGALLKTGNPIVKRQSGLTTTSCRSENSAINSKLLVNHAGWGMRIVFVPDDELEKVHPIEIREPEADLRSQEDVLLNLYGHCTIPWAHRQPPQVGTGLLWQSS
jgi:hypothetical protein